MNTTRRTAIVAGLTSLGAASVGASSLAGCAQDSGEGDDALTKVYVLGAIHRRHRTSERYSLDILRGAIRKAQPDLVLTEIPPDRIAEARRSFAETGEVTESRTRAFPELTDVVFPLSAEMGFRMVATAGWTQEIADNRRRALAAIEADPARAPQWAEHRQARADFSAALKGRGDDPRFLHSEEYDALVEAAQTPYQTYFDGDLGPGGWTQINAAHTGLIGEALDVVSGQGLTVLILFGAFHKYLIRRSVLLRDDVQLLDAAQLFV
ncbi:MAG: hypothetical protein AAFR64_10910 [Pseudomonadota bacterium]